MASSSSFVAVNQSSPQTLTPHSSVVTRAHEARRRPTVTGKRRHNRTIAQYLGLGNRNEPEHLEKYAPMSPCQDPQTGLLEQRTNNLPTRTPVTTSESSFPTQQLVSQSFRVAKTARKMNSTKPQPYAPIPPVSTLSQTSFQTLPFQSEPDFGTDHDLSSDQRNHTSNNFSQNSSIRDGDDQTIDAFEFLGDIDEDRLSDHDSFLRFGSFPTQQAATDTFLEDEDFDEGVMDDDLLGLAHDPSPIFYDDCPKTYHTEGLDLLPMQAESEVAHDVPKVVEKAICAESSRNLRKKFEPPLTQTSQLLAATGDVGNGDARKPIVRPCFPGAVRDRSPVIGLSSSTLLRTCFRIGEVVNQSHQAWKTGQNITFELYARILESDRTETQQNFAFCDMFHARPPYIKGIYHANIWASVPLYEYDSRRLLQKGRICRSIGTTKRVNEQWVMTVLNIWEATWEDIKWVEGIVSF